MLPAANTRSSRVTLLGSLGRLSVSTLWPIPWNTPLAITRLATVFSVPDAPDLTMTPLNIWCPLVFAVAGEEIANEVAIATSAATTPLMGLLMPSPFVSGPRHAAAQAGSDRLSQTPVARSTPDSSAILRASTRDATSDSIAPSAQPLQQP